MTVGRLLRSERQAAVRGGCDHDRQLSGYPRMECQMSLVRVYIAFDYDNDQDLKTLLVGQARNEDSPFEISDWSIKEASVSWEKEARERIRKSSQVAVLCGEQTNTATGVSKEIEIAREEGKAYFLLWGRATKSCTKPKAARDTDRIYKWTWPNLKALIAGSRGGPTQARSVAGGAADSR